MLIMGAMPEAAAAIDTEIMVALPGAQVTHYLPDVHGNAPKRRKIKTTAASSDLEEIN